MLMENLISLRHINFFESISNVVRNIYNFTNLHLNNLLGMCFYNIESKLVRILEKDVIQKMKNGFLKNEKFHFSHFRK